MLRAVVLMVKVVLTGLAPAVTVGGEKEQEACRGTPAVQAKETLPAKPLLPLIVMMNGADWPAVTVWGGGGEVKEKSGLGGRKPAATMMSFVIVITQSPVPVHRPSQPTNWFPGSRVAVSVRVVPAANGAWQRSRQLMLGGDEVTVPVPQQFGQISSTYTLSIVKPLTLVWVMVESVLLTRRIFRGFPTEIAPQDDRWSGGRRRESRAWLFCQYSSGKRWRRTHTS
jgi:hypothetical protein